MSLCPNIDTLAMAYLDDELASEERRELELHLLDCASCKHHVDAERAELGMLRNALAAPPAPDVLKARIAHALDDEDRQAARVSRRRWGAWVLPGSAVAAAAAAIVAFISVRAPVSEAEGRVPKAAVMQSVRGMPLEVEGVSTGPWLRQHFARDVAPPQFTQPGIDLVGARLTDVSGHQAAIVQYLVTDGQNRFPLTAVVIDDLRADDLSGGVPVKIGDRMLHLQNIDGIPAVTFVDEQGLGYAFASKRLTAQELLQLVVTSDLIGRAQQGR